jgi:hypothetical protein
LASVLISAVWELVFMLVSAMATITIAIAIAFGGFGDTIIDTAVVGAGSL